MVLTPDACQNIQSAIAFEDVCPAHNDNSVINRKEVKNLRRKTREKVFQVLYMSDLRSSNLEKMMSDVNSLLDDEFDREYFVKSLEGIGERMGDIDDLISRSVEHWKFSRISYVDRNILRLGVFELLFSHEKIPYPIVINEAVELAKRFGAEESGAFVNGVLDSIRKKEMSGGGGSN